jgi:hypothetical protein
MPYSLDYANSFGVENKTKGNLAGGGFDPPTFGLWAQHASSAPTRFDVRNCLSIAPYKAFRHKEESSHTPPQHQQETTETNSKHLPITFFGIY